jgi:regulator of protease activity HflC (stomatin/prohibitin superfamily)
MTGDEGIELMKRLERERQEEVRHAHDELLARRRRALERPEARAEWDAALAEADERDAWATGTWEEWLGVIAIAAVRAREAGEALPEREDLEAMRNWFLRHVDPDDLGRYRELLMLPDAALAELADRFWLHEHGIDDEN